MTALELTNISRCLTPVQRILLDRGAPILEEAVVARHKRYAKFGMLWRTVRWVLLGITALVAFESLGGNWLRTLVVGSAGLLLGGLFTWLVSGLTSLGQSVITPGTGRPTKSRQTSLRWQTPSKTPASIVNRSRSNI
jgi:hypothetical protein